MSTRRSIDVRARPDGNLVLRTRPRHPLTGVSPVHELLASVLVCRFELLILARPYHRQLVLQLIADSQIYLFLLDQMALLQRDQPLLDLGD